MPSFLTITEFLISLISGGGFGNIKSLSLSTVTEDDALFVVTNDVSTADGDPFNCSCFTFPLSWESNPGWYAGYPNRLKVGSTLGNTVWLVDFSDVFPLLTRLWAGGGYSTFGTLGGLCTFKHRKKKKNRTQVMTSQKRKQQEPSLTNKQKIQ